MKDASLCCVLHKNNYSLQPGTSRLLELQRFCTVSRNNEIFKCRPQQNPTTKQLLQYVLKQEIMATASLESYSGINQSR